MNMTWDAEKYTSDFSFVYRYGNDVTELIDAKAGSSVLDLGCGNGALTRVLFDKGYKVVGMDASGELLRLAAEKNPQIEFVQADATDFSLEKPVDVVFSNAVFHWIDKEKQPDMMRCVFRALKSGGRFVFELGGYENNRLIHGALAKAFERRGLIYRIPFYFPSIGEYSSLLEQAGFLVTYALLFDRPTELKGEDGLGEWIKMFLKEPFAAAGAEAEKEAIVAEALEELRGTLYKGGKWYADYVRLRMKAVRP